MSHLNSVSVSDCSPLSFLEQNPYLSDSLFADCDFSFDEVSTIVEPVLQAKKRCQVTSSYIQAVTTGRTTFLATNLTENRDTHITEIASSWLVGRSTTCALPVMNASVSRCHAVIGHHPNTGFYITDVGSSNGTWVNGHRLESMERRSLRDGDLVRLGNLRIEFFAVTRSRVTQVLSDATCF